MNMVKEREGRCLSGLLLACMVLSLVDFKGRQHSDCPAETPSGVAPLLITPAKLSTDLSYTPLRAIHLFSYSMHAAVIVAQLE